MVTLTYDEWVEKFRPIQNPYFVDAEGKSLADYNGTLFSPDLLAQISGFIPERKLWTLIEVKKVVDILTQVEEKFYIIKPGCTTMPPNLGFFVTDEKYEQSFTTVTEVPNPQ